MLILHILCGFGIDEVASAFVTTYTAVEKRIPRAKKVLTESKRLFDTQVPGDFSARLPAVQRALYLLFNEGYHGASAEFAVRAELCQEAMRLAALLLEHPWGATASSYALSALMCLNKARLPARLDASGNLNSLMNQDRSLWDQNLVSEGLQILDLSAKGSELTEYHLEAAIAAVHATASSVRDTDWVEIVSLYDMLMGIRPTPIVALNRAIAVGQRDGPERGQDELRTIADAGRLAGIPSTKRRWPNLSCIVVILKLLVSILRTLSKSHATRRSGSSSKKGSETAKNTELNGQGGVFLSASG